MASRAEPRQGHGPKRVNQFVSAASLLVIPCAIPNQNRWSSDRPATGGRPGDGNGARPERCDRRFRMPIATSSVRCCDDRWNPPNTRAGPTPNFCIAAASRRALAVSENLMTTRRRELHENPEPGRGARSRLDADDARRRIGAFLDTVYPAPTFGAIISRRRNTNRSILVDGRWKRRRKWDGVRDFLCLSQGCTPTVSPMSGQFGATVLGSLVAFMDDLPDRLLGHRTLETVPP